MELVPTSREANPHRLVFPSPRGERRQKPLGNGWPEIVDGKQRWVDPFKDALATAGVTRNVRWEDLRHTCGLSLIRGLWGPTWSLVEVRDMLGLNSIRGVERYTRQPTDTDPSPTLGAIAAIRTFCDNIAAQLDLLAESENRQAAGLVFEQLLNQWFAFAGLHPREPFRVRGEQIDGSFVLDHEVYLLEAKWEKAASPAKDLYAFREKIIGKSAHTRGVFITIKGITTEADTAIRTGKQLHFFVVVGAELRRLLRDGASLADFLRDRQRLLAEQGLLLSKSSETSSASSRR